MSQDLRILTLALALCFCLPADAGGPTWEIAERIEVGRVPSSFPVGFSLLTHGERQYVAYYDVEHRMTLATRTLGEHKWQRQILDSKVGWDSHNYLTMAIDVNGHLHLFDGQGRRNAYPLGPVTGPDGRFHVVWVWRDTPDCATNNNLSYARSRDLIHWETAARSWYSTRDSAP